MTKPWNSPTQDLPYCLSDCLLHCLSGFIIYFIIFFIIVYALSLVYPIPIGSMYAIYGNIYHEYTPNVSIYTSTMDPMGY